LQIGSSIYPCKSGALLSEDEQLLLDINYQLSQFNASHLTCICDEHCESNKDCVVCVNSDAGYQIDDYECLVPVSYLMKFRKIQQKFDLDKFRYFLLPLNHFTVTKS